MAWCTKAEVSSLAVSPVHVDVCLMCVLQESSMFSNVKIFQATTRIQNEMAGLTWPTDHQLVKVIWRVTQRILPSVLHKKKPLTLEHLRQLVHRTSDDSPLPQLMTLAAILLVFFGFFWFNDLADVWLDWTCLHDTHVKISAKQGRTISFVRAFGFMLWPILTPGYSL